VGVRNEAYTQVLFQPRQVSAATDAWVAHTRPVLPAPGSRALRPELAALRQRIYKLDNARRHRTKQDEGQPGSAGACLV
jgi:hypothetical protein